MTKTKCNKCGAIENTKASVGSRCIFCEIGIMRKIEEVTHPFVLLGIILILAACAPLQDNFPVPKESSPTTEQPVQPVNDTANVTNIPPPPKEILLPADGLGVYLLDADSKGTSIITLNGKSLLINPNQDTIRTLKIVKNLGIANLDYLILTNSDDNNIAGAAPIILRAKPATNAGSINQVLSARAKQSMVKASRPITRRRNLYPPMRRSACGARRSPKMEAKDASAYMRPIVSLCTSSDRKLEFM